MKIAIDARILRTSTGRYVERLLHYLQEIDHDNDYVVLLDHKDYDGWEPTNARFRKVSVDIPNYSIREQIVLPSLLRGLKVDLVHFAMPQQPILYAGPSITTIHDLTLLHFKNYEDSARVVYDIKQLIFRGVLAFAVRKSRHIITPTEYVQQDLIKTLHAKPSNVTVTYEAADKMPSGKSSTVSQLATSPFIMYVGRMDPYKNIRSLIAAHQQLLQAYPDLRLALPGAKDRNVQKLEQWCRDQDFRQIYFLGFVSDAELRWLFEHTLGYVFPSLSEGFGLPGLEAMAHGAPVIASRATCLPEVYQDGAHYFDPTSIGDIAEKISDVLEDEKLRTSLIKEGSKVVAQYSWKRMAEQTLEVYQRALTRRG